MKRKMITTNDVDYKDLIEEIDYVKETICDQYIEVSKRMNSNDDTRNELVDAITFAPSSLFVEEDGKRLQYNSNFLGMNGLDSVVGSIGICDDMLAIIGDNNITEKDRCTILSGMAYTMKYTQEAFLNTIAMKYVAIKSEFVCGIWYKTADYLKYITNDRIILHDITADVHMWDISEINTILDNIDLYNQIESGQLYVFNDLVNRVLGSVLPFLFGNTFGLVNNVIMETIYNSQQLKMKFTPDEINMIYHMVHDQLGQYLHLSWNGVFEEMSKLLRYIHAYKIRTGEKFDCIRRIEYDE